MSHLEHARQVFEIEIAGLIAVRDQLDDAFDQAVNAAVECVRNRGKIIVVGIGKSGNIGRKIAATLTSTGSPSVVLDSVDALHGDLGIVSDGDLVLTLSYSGESEELLNLMASLKRFAVPLVAFTGAPKSALANLSDIVLTVTVPREACPFNLAPTASTTAMLALGDALAMSVLQARGFKEKDFAQRHPSGAIGRALLLRIEDIMRSGSRNVVAIGAMTVKEALLSMTKARCGSVSIVDATGRLIGVFTDGDLRRHMATDETILGRPLTDVMTRNPICIQMDALAVEALKLFDQRNIDDLIVVDGNGGPVGLVDSQDLPKLKLM